MMKANYNIPILFVIFKRPEVTQASFKKICAARPRKLYIVSDGARPNHEGEQELVEQTRKIVLDAIDWDCELHTDFRDENMGCGKGMYHAISWLFQNEEMGIVLEDDCVVQPSFFTFMEEMLTKYQDDNRIGLVAGFNGVASKVRLPWSYCFSRYKATWGWGSWRRAWSHMDFDMTWRGGCQEASVINNMGYRSKDLAYWRHRLNLIDQNEVSAWDWQWFFSMAAQNQLTVFPAKSLVSNIGFGAGATHTGLLWGNAIMCDDGDLEFPLSHPTAVCPYVPFEKAFYRYNNDLYTTINCFVPLWFKHVVKRFLSK